MKNFKEDYSSYPGSDMYDFTSDPEALREGAPKCEEYNGVKELIDEMILSEIGKDAIAEGTFCSECNGLHQVEESFCRNCGACLYVNSIQDEEAVKETGLPFHICTRCNTSNFWD